MTIKDSGNRTEFESGAVRDVQEGKGRCDLLPLGVVAALMEGSYARIFGTIAKFQNDGDVIHLFRAVDMFAEIRFGDCHTMLLETSKHFEDGAKKYGERNWEKGIPVHRYIDSAIRHYLKFLRGDDDEPHDRAFCWNIMCAIWTCKHHPDLNDFAVKDGGSDD